ncbi:hypothetical protein GOP47_0025233 [Adiantum capillus-veneris]|uniref:Uncharacterized protein n=1 Tax=Adiantum capillus-veneris TaxID=13818 RepID=A0A9D4U4E8_ADICA|nr:hypothetical protein GOP47_0025233 [Adiantum capillus-veneris]
MDLVKDTLKANPNSSVIGFNDNSSAIRGFLVDVLRPKNPGSPSALLTFSRDFDPQFSMCCCTFSWSRNRCRRPHKRYSCNGYRFSAGYCVGNLQLDGGIAPW